MNRVALTAMLMCLAGCASTNTTMSPNGSPKTVAAATADQKATLIDRVKTLEGTWLGVDEHGKATGSEVVFALTGRGSAVREIMLPHTDNEMTNLYTMDGPTLVMTHYCASGNQPRMRAAAGDGKSIALKFDGVSNLRSAGEMYMGEMTLTFADADHFSETWRHFKGGAETGDPKVFHFVRKK
jgi:hypothetical protein